MSSFRPPAPKKPQDHRLKVVPQALQQKSALTPKVTLQYRQYGDTPGFGFELITINGVTIYLACNFTPDGKIVRPQQGVALFFTEQEADAFKAQLQAKAQKPQLILPGDPRWQKPQR